MASFYTRNRQPNTALEPSAPAVSCAPRLSAIVRPPDDPFVEERSSMLHPVKDILLACVVISVGIGDLAVQSPSSPSREETTLRSYDGRTMPAQIVRMTVPEKRANPVRTISVAAVHIPTTAERPGRPIVFLMGGPGIPATVMAAVPPYFTLFQRLREQADVILVDQRGIGMSEPSIDCPVNESAPTDLFLSRERFVQLTRDRVTSCASQFRSNGIDPTAYNTIESADDIEALRKALGVEQIDLLAFSYGSRLALMYVQRHGGHVGRVVLQGVNGPGLVLKRPAPVTRKLDRIAEALKNDSAWRGPTELRAVAQAARQRLAKTPARVTISDRRTGRQLDLAVGRDGFDALVGLSPDDARLPALLVSVAANDDRVLARFVEAAWNGMGTGTVGLMARAVNCAADRPDSRWALVRSESATAPFDMPIDNEFLTDQFCQSVGYTTPPVEFAGSVRSSVPLLLITGSLDSTNPIENADDVARGFTNAVSFEIENAVHEALPVPAVQDVVVDWFRGADVRGRRLAAPPPRFASVEAASAPVSQRGR
jgi:pimeloyl-ACP methyl ester carboxylesterase